MTTAATAAEFDVKDALETLRSVIQNLANMAEKIGVSDAKECDARHHELGNLRQGIFTARDLLDAIEIKMAAPPTKAQHEEP